MTQKYYAKHILPLHLDEIDRLSSKYGKKFLFQEDNDGSHGTRSYENPPARLKRQRGVQILLHPANSPDLNPIEAIWQIIKQRLRGGSWQTVAEFKEAILKEWKRITLAEIQRRISEMPWRCKRIVQLEGRRIRSSVW
jgi:transposase